MKALLFVLGLALLLGLSMDARATGTTPVITSATHAKGVPANASIATFQWEAVPGFPASAHYLHSLTLDPEAEPTATDNETSQRTATLLLPAIGQWWFHVAAVAGDDRSPTGHYGPVSRNLTLQQRCAAAFQAQGEEGPNDAALAECIAATQNEFAPEAIMALFMAFLAKFGSATLRRG